MRKDELPVYGTEAILERAGDYFWLEGVQVLHQNISFLSKDAVEGDDVMKGVEDFALFA